MDYSANKWRSVAEIFVTIFLFLLFPQVSDAHHSGRHHWLSGPSEKLTCTRCGPRYCSWCINNKNFKNDAPNDNVNNKLSCNIESFIMSVSSSGKIIELADGSIWKVSLIDTVKTMIWLPASEVLVCESRLIINKDNGEKARVVKVN